ncbi:MAG: YHS domain-containing protein [bacterium]|nr:YHS domain-containing protein [bacterium]
MRTIHPAIVLPVALAALLLVAAVGGQPEHAAGAAPVMKEMEGNICPVMAGPIDKRYTYTYKGTVYYFCCPACIEKFSAEPEKYVPGVRGGEETGASGPAAADGGR